MKTIRKLQRKTASFTFITKGEQEACILNRSTMLHLTVQNQEYRRLQHSFKAWLEQLNYEQSTIHYSPIRLTEFFHWLESKQIKAIHQITRKTITAYFDYLQERQHHRKGGKLSKNYLRAHQQTLRKLSRYLRETGRESFEVAVQLPGRQSGIKTILTPSEIMSLYECTGDDVLGHRDKVMLGIYYGCGLRKSEGSHLDVTDILPDKHLVYVRKGKNYKERYVPVAGQVLEDILAYHSYRQLLSHHENPALFLSNTGQRLSGHTMSARFKKLLQKAGVDKPAGLHTLRHSIATHLLQSGMRLEQISLFLGHSSLESTRIYTQTTFETAQL